MAPANTMSSELTGGLGFRTSQNRSLNGSLKPSVFYGASPLPSKSFTPHHPSLLRHASGPATAPQVPTSTFQVVLNSSPSKVFASDSYTAPSTAPKKRGRPFKDPQGSPTAQAPAKKKGRPFKTAEAAAAALAKANSDNTPKKRGRPFRYALAPEHLVSVVPPEPNFIPFVCEWKNCPAELHNLDTLRAHLYTVHLRRERPAKPMNCLWKKCCQEDEVMDRDSGARSVLVNGVEFPTEDEWRNHINSHLDHVARWQGDGPKAAMNFLPSTTGSKPSLSYLYDKDGKQVTPLLINQPIEEGRAKQTNSARFQKQREGLYVVYESKDDPELYLNFEDGINIGGEAGMDDS